MTTEDDDEKQDLAATKWWQPRFHLGSLLIVVLAVCVLAAATGYLVRSYQHEGITSVLDSGSLVFILIILAAPMLLMIAVSIGRQIIVWLNRRRLP